MDEKHFAALFLFLACEMQQGSSGRGKEGKESCRGARVQMCGGSGGVLGLFKLT